ncbi:hypothetical protein KUV62_06140 [Salipiger bermudensis]|uniref:hypothetical protein n=1 Tax=Salipiger bermudensis TaxID=344736 RepID=UPI001C9A021D|nr:hypothetical protein [Salipiger bermudensis]MBY6003476.1 hypothetical protein [Salipiger bermudensis]
MPRLSLTLLTGLLLAGCAGEEYPRDPGRELLPRALTFKEQVAANAVAPILARKAPSVPTETAVGCTIAYARQGQIDALAENSALGQPELNDDIVTDILFAQGTRECMSDNLIDRVLF